VSSFDDSSTGALLSAPLHPITSAAMVMTPAKPLIIDLIAIVSSFAFRGDDVQRPCRATVSMNTR
jgi:hypothetical protein